MTDTAQHCSPAFVTTAKSTTFGLSSGTNLGEPENPEEEIPALLASIAEGLDKLCAELVILDSAVKRYLVGKAVSKIKE